MIKFIKLMISKIFMKIYKSYEKLWKIIKLMIDDKIYKTYDWW
jgi:hypothetical protein